MDSEILEQYNDADWDMGIDREMEEAIARNSGHWTIEDVYRYLYGTFAGYDEPQKAMSYCDVTSPRYRGGDWWNQWKREHWMGCEGMCERALKDPYVCSYLKRFGLLPEEELSGGTATS